MTEIPIVVSNNEVTVGGFVEQVELQLSVGPRGQRGSKIFSGDANPNSLPIDSPYWGGYTEFLVGDTYIQRAADLLAMWEWLFQGGEYTWVKTVDNFYGTSGGGSGTSDPDLDAIAALTGTGILKRTGINTWALDNAAYLTGNQTVTLSGDATGSGTTAITVSVNDDSHNHTGATISDLPASSISSGTFSILRIPTGTTGSTVALGNHTHPYQPVDNDLTAIAGISGTGYLKRTGVDTWILDTPAAAVWGNITGTLADQADLNSALSGKQAADADLTAIAALAGTSGLLRKTAANTWSLDTNAYITGNQTITLGGDASGSGTTSITVTVADDSHAHTGSTISALDAGDTTTGTFDIARIPTGTTGSTVALGNHTHSYQPIDGDLTAIAALAGTSGFLKKTAADTWSLDTAAYLTGNQTVTLSGDVTGSGTTAITATLANSGVSAGTYNNVASQVRPFTVDAKGRVTGIGAAVNIAITQSAVTNLVSDLAAKAPIASPTFTGKVTTAASAAGGAGFNLPHGSAPTSPANGDIWTTSSSVFARINGVTKDIGAVSTGDVVGPGSATDTSIALFDGVTGKLIKNSGFMTYQNGTGIVLGYGPGDPGVLGENLTSAIGSLYLNTGTYEFDRGAWFKSASSGTDNGWQRVIMQADSEIWENRVALFGDQGYVKQAYLTYEEDEPNDMSELHNSGIGPLRINYPYDTGEGWSDKNEVWTGPHRIYSEYSNNRIVSYLDNPEDGGGAISFSVDKNGNVKGESLTASGTLYLNSQSNLVSSGSHMEIWTNNSTDWFARGLYEESVKWKIDENAAFVREVSSGPALKSSLGFLASYGQIEWYNGNPYGVVDGHRGHVIIDSSSGNMYINIGAIPA